MRVRPVRIAKSRAQFLPSLTRRAVLSLDFLATVAIPPAYGVQSAAPDSRNPKKNNYLRIWSATQQIRDFDRIIYHHSQT